MSDRTHCQHPDRDMPKIKCGYPLPCPYHTAVVDTTKAKVTVTVCDRDNKPDTVHKLMDIGRTVKKESEAE